MRLRLRMEHLMGFGLLKDGSKFSGHKKSLSLKASTKKPNLNLLRI